MKEWIILRGKVIDMDGNPLAGTRITSYNHDTFNEPGISQEDYGDLGSINPKSVYADENGRFELKGVRVWDCQFYFKGLETERL